MLRWTYIVSVIVGAHFIISSGVDIPLQYKEFEYAVLQEEQWRPQSEDKTLKTNTIQKNYAYQAI